MEIKNAKIPIIEENISDNNSWINNIKAIIKTPFDIHLGPPLKILHLRNINTNEFKLIFIANHALCDGLSLFYIFKDLLKELSSQTTISLPNPPKSFVDLLSSEIKIGKIEKFVLKKINQKWKLEEVIFDDLDFNGIREGFWNNINYNINCLKFSQEETQYIIDICHKNKITVNSLILASVLFAHSKVFGKKDSYYGKIAIAADLRNYSKPKIGNHLGLYARGIDIYFKYKDNLHFIQNAKKIHKIIQKENTPKKLIRPLLSLQMISQNLIDGLLVKVLGKFISKAHPKYSKIQNFLYRNDIALKVLKIKKMDKISKNIIITNIGRLPIQLDYPEFKLESINFIPPLTLISKHILGVATANNKLIINFVNYEQITSSNKTKELISQIRQIILKL